MKKTFSFLVAALIFCGCSATSPQLTNSGSGASVSQDLKNSMWVLDKIDGKKMKFAIIEGRVMGVSLLSFDANAISGNTGVNQFKSPYVAGNGSINIVQPLAMTKMISFHKTLADNERDILSILNNADLNYAIGRNSLILSSKKSSLQYEKYNPLSHSSWVLTRINDKALDRKGLNRPPMIAFERETISGFLGTTKFDANYLITPNGLKVSNLQKIGEKETNSAEANTLERDFTSIITNIPSIQMSVPTMLILHSSHENLTFTRAAFADLLNNSRWQLSDMSGVTMSGTQSIEFRDGNVFGNGGINNFSGIFALEDRKIYFSPLAMTEKAGSKTAMEMEKRYLRALENAEYIDFKDRNVFTLFSDNENLTFARVR